MSEARSSEFWREHYERIAFDTDGTPVWHLDLSNERCQSQSFAVALQLLGPVRGGHVLDAGCGWGQMSHVLAALGAEVVGVDFNRRLIAELRRRYPGVTWRDGDLARPDLVLEAGEAFNAMVFVEVLQYLPGRECLPAYWSALKPGGRLVAVVPNSACPIVGRVEERFRPRFAGLDRDGVRQLAESLGHVDGRSVLGLFFRDDQRLAPYDVRETASDPGGRGAEPNRLAFAFEKASDARVER